MICPNCGVSVNNQDNYCRKCGKSLRQRQSSRSSDNIKYTYCSCCGTYYNKQETTYCPRCQLL